MFGLKTPPCNAPSTPSVIHLFSHHSNHICHPILDIPHVGQGAEAIDTAGLGGIVVVVARESGVSGISVSIKTILQVSLDLSNPHD
jgi:hypothetical protein